MPNEDRIREIAAKACQDALQERALEIAADVARRMEAALAMEPAATDHSKELRDGAVLIAECRTQTEALEGLLAATSAITPGCGLLILRGTHAMGWSCLEFTAVENFKRATMDCSGGIAAKVIASCAGVVALASELDPVFIAKLGLDGSAKVLLIPVRLKERVAALLLAVQQHDSDLAGVEVLVQVAQLTMDLQAYRKGVPQPAREAPRAAAAVPAAIPQRAIAAPAVAPIVAAEPAYTTAASEVASRAVVPAAAPVVQEPVVPVAPVLDEAHEKARRFAKLLVEEIKLYNQTKVAEGRARGDLYARLHDDIEKSRGAYHKRYGESVRDVDYFTQELLRILADNNRSAMGPGFPG